MLQPFHTFAVALAHAKLGNLGQARSGYALFQQQVSEYFAMRKLKADCPKQLFEIGDHTLC